MLCIFMCCDVVHWLAASLTAGTRWYGNNAQARAEFIAESVYISTSLGPGQA
jgi:hypothetical protein